MMEKFYRTYADIDLDAIRHNIRFMQKGLKEGVRTCAVIKADGYGHGAVPIAKEILDIVDFYAVACMEEAMELVRNKIRKPILILSMIHCSYFEEAVKHGVRLTISDLKSAQQLNRIAKALKKKAFVHLKINTGMNRIGLLPTEESKKIIEKISRMEGVRIEGIFTHLHSADEKDLASAKKQIRKFQAFTEELAKEGVRIPIRHCANSAGTIRMKEADFDMVRIGIALYGLYPSPVVRPKYLKPAMSLYSRVTMVKTIAKGETVGYNAKFTAARKTRIATISVGYADGYLRNLSNKGSVLIRGKKVKIVGNVCMDQIMADVTSIPDVKVDDLVVLVGKSGGKGLSMEEVAGLGGTINYEFACGITRRVAKRYLRKGKVVYRKESC